MAQYQQEYELTDGALIFALTEIIKRKRVSIICRMLTNETPGLPDGIEPYGGNTNALRVRLSKVCGGAFPKFAGRSITKDATTFDLSTAEGGIGFLEDLIDKSTSGELKLKAFTMLNDLRAKTPPQPTEDDQLAGVNPELIMLLALEVFDDKKLGDERQLWIMKEQLRAAPEAVRQGIVDHVNKQYGRATEHDSASLDGPIAGAPSKPDGIAGISNMPDLGAGDNDPADDEPDAGTVSGKGKPPDPPPNKPPDKKDHGYNWSVRNPGNLKFPKGRQPDLDSDGPLTGDNN